MEGHRDMRMSGGLKCTQLLIAKWTSPVCVQEEEGTSMSFAVGEGSDTFCLNLGKVVLWTFHSCCIFKASWWMLEVITYKEGVREHLCCASG